MAGRAVGEEHELVAPLAQREEQRQQDRQDQQPVADADVDHDGARRRAQHEADRYGQHVDDDDVLQRPGVEGEQADVRRAEQAEGRPEPERGPEGGDAEHRGRRQRGRHRNRAGRDRPIPLDRMAAIGLPVRHVVEEIDDAGERAEDDERGEGIQDRPRVQQPLAEQQRGEDDEVLRPLRRPERQDEARGQRPRRDADARLTRLGPLDDVRNAVSRHLERGGCCWRGLANC